MKSSESHSLAAYNIRTSILWGIAMPDSLLKRLVAEFIGVFALCFIGIMAISVAAGDSGSAALVHVAFAHGLTIAVMVAALGAISGAHFNPAVTFGFLIARRMDLPTGFAYIIAQLAGGLIAAIIIAVLFDAGTVAGGTPQVAGGITMAQAVVLEIITTFFLVLVVFGTAVDERAPKYVFPLAIGLVVVLDIMAIGPITGAAMNPARVFGPLLSATIFDAASTKTMWGVHWVYWVGPLVGGGLAGALQHFFLLPGGLPRRLDELS
jgi:aquaporin Z